MSRPVVALTLLSNASATGTWLQWPGGKGAFAVEATFGGGTVKLQVKGPAGGAIDVSSATTLTAAGAGIFELPPCEIRANVATATAVYATATRFDV